MQGKVDFCRKAKRRMRWSNPTSYILLITFIKPWAIACPILLQLRLCHRSQRSLANRQVAATRSTRFFCHRQRSYRSPRRPATKKPDGNTPSSLCNHSGIRCIFFRLSFSVTYGIIFSATTEGRRLALQTEGTFPSGKEGGADGYI